MKNQDYKLSRYNITVDLNKDEKLLFNCMSSGLIKLDKKFSNLFETVSSKLGKKSLNEKEKTFLEKLIEGRYIVDKNLNEIDLLRLRCQESKFQKDHYGLTICPTLDCNLRCIYCYENRKTKHMGKKEIEKIKKLVANKIEKIKSLNITWYGGEPLLYPKIIDELTDYFIKECEKFNVLYNAKIVTNGTLIDKLDESFFTRNKINNAQITIDGPQIIHDQRKPFANGMGSFNKILNNLRTLLKKSLSVSVRVNIDETNLKKIEPLFPILEPLKRKYSEKFVIYFAAVDTTGFGACRSLEEGMTRKNFSEYKLKLIDSSKNYGFTYEVNPKTKFTNCMIYSTTSFVVDPECKLYKCWYVVGEQKHCVGVINDKGSIDMTNYSYWLDCVMNDPIQRKECLDCEILPLCLGGCPMKAAENSKLGPCLEYKFQIKEVLKRYYESKTEQKAVS
ncbi:MAG: radical SAM protein [Candidatus Atribacteria bacterium]|nr:radical SAM protein [Candidatus Atribacteria bacterium]